MAPRWERHHLAFLLLFLTVVVMGVFDAHPEAAGKSTGILTGAVYPKVYVHLVGGVALTAFLIPLTQDYYHPEWLAAVQATVLGFLYEGIQWANPRGPWWGGVFTFQEGVAVALGALILALWYGALSWQPGGGDYASGR
jgi:hypothetical protein